MVGSGLRDLIRGIRWVLFAAILQLAAAPAAGQPPGEAQASVPVEEGLVCARFTWDGRDVQVGFQPVSEVYGAHRRSGWIDSRTNEAFAARLLEEARRRIARSEYGLWEDYFDAKYQVYGKQPSDILAYDGQLLFVRRVDPGRRIRGWLAAWRDSLR